MPATMERASFGLREVKLAADAMTFSGYGAVFGNVDSYGDVIQPGAFADTLAASQKSGDWPAMLMQHGGYGMGADDMTPVGIWTEMAEDSIGLRVAGKLADTARGQDAYKLLKMEPRPAIKGLSIGYMVKAYEARTRPEEPRRKLTKLDLFEVSLVTFPANPKAQISSVKSSGGLTIRDAEDALREAGFSRTEAKAIVARGFKTIDQREAGGNDTEAALSRLLSTLSS
jgi:HK97 family phage prohead protease